MTNLKSDFDSPFFSILGSMVYLLSFSCFIFSLAKERKAKKCCMDGFFDG